MFTVFYNPKEELLTIPIDDIKNGFKRIKNFLERSSKENFVYQIEESSEVFQLVNTIKNDENFKDNIIRINIFVITNFLYNNKNNKILNNELLDNKINIFYKFYDIEKLAEIYYNQNSKIEVDFEDGDALSLFVPTSHTSDCQSLVTVIQAEKIVKLYQEYGSRLLQQNVRSFLQFTGKINKGIRKTILDEPEMFFPYNNGITATASNIEFFDDNLKTMSIKKITDLQIVNGGQTTASLYHTYKKDRANIDNIFIQIKLNIIKNETKYYSIVSRIAEYTNTQNKVTFADLSSNRQFHIELEKLSRSIKTPYTIEKNYNTIWFFERARGQYKNEKAKQITKSQKNNFDLIYPRNQVFTKEEMAKYYNAFSEIYDKKNRLIIGPHIVVRGSQKNYVEFIKFIGEIKPDSIFYEDLIAKAIIFKNCEKIYGVGPNSLGDLRYIVVPYTISLFTFLLKEELDLFKIWTNQSISEDLKELFKKLMITIEIFIKDNAPKALYGEWAKREECWTLMKEKLKDLEVSLDSNSFVTPNTNKRIVRFGNETYYTSQKEKIKNLTVENWLDLYNLVMNTSIINPIKFDHFMKCYNKIRRGEPLLEDDINQFLKIYEKLEEANISK